MKKNDISESAGQDIDAMRPECDFSAAVRGVTAARYGRGTNVVLVGPDVMDVFPDAEAVNKALRPLPPILRRQWSDSSTKRSGT